MTNITFPKQNHYKKTQASSPFPTKPSLNSTSYPHPVSNKNNYSSSHQTPPNSPPDQKQHDQIYPHYNYD